MHRRHLLGVLACAPIASMLRAGGLPISPKSTDVDDWSATNSFNGVIATGRRGKVVSLRTFGKSDVESGTATAPSTRYAIGSVSKWLTTAAILRLVDRGTLDLDAPITTYLPTFRAETGRQVSLRHLMSNSSGIPDQLTAAAKIDRSLRSSTASAAEMVATYAGGDLAFRPGSRFDYTVLNWAIVRAILEARTGQPFAALIDKLVLQPLKLHETGIAEHGFAAVPGLAAGYRSLDPPVRDMDPIGGFAAASGTFYSTAGDLVSAAHGIFGRKLLSARARKEMLTVQIPEEEYAIGGRIHLIGGGIWAWETGRVGGYRAHIAHDLAADRTIIVLCNNGVAQAAISTLVETLAVMPGIGQPIRRSN